MHYIVQTLCVLIIEHQLANFFQGKCNSLFKDNIDKLLIHWEIIVEEQLHCFNFHPMMNLCNQSLFLFKKKKRKRKFGSVVQLLLVCGNCIHQSACIHKMLKSFSADNADGRIDKLGEMDFYETRSILICISWFNDELRN